MKKPSAALLLSTAFSSSSALAHDLEAACLDVARAGRVLPAGATYSAISATDPAGRTFVRLTWAPSPEKADRRWRAYRCTFEGDRMIKHENEAPPIT